MTQVLVVDDSQFVRTALAAELGDRGYDVVTASDGEAAIEATVEREPDVVTMDVRMPGTDGIEAVQRIMARRPTPIVVLSAHTREGADATLDALSLGAMAVIPKPGGDATAGVSELADELAETIDAVRDADVASVTWERAAAAARTAASAERAVQAASAAVNGASRDAPEAGAQRREEFADEPSSGTAAADGSRLDGAAADAPGTESTSHAASLPTGGRPSTSEVPPTGDPVPTRESPSTAGPAPLDDQVPTGDPLASEAPLPVGDRSLPASTVPVTASPDASPTIVLGASTGGPRILERILAELPRELDARVLVVQHMPASFTDRLARRLDDVSEYDVREASDGSRLVDGEALVARGGYHMALRYAGDEHLRVRLTEDDHVHGVRPAIDVTMRTAAERVDGPLVGVALSGMGRDAADGVGAIARAGGTAIVQDPSDAPVEGIPRHAVATGDVDRMLPTTELASGIVDATLEQTADAPGDDPADVPADGDVVGEDAEVAREDAEVAREDAEVAREDAEVAREDADVTERGDDGDALDGVAAEEDAPERRDARAARPEDARVVRPGGGDRGW